MDLLLLSECAIDHVTNTVRIRTGNRFEGINRLQNEKSATNDLVSRGRAFARQEFRRLGLEPGVEEVFLRSQIAQHVHSGNCTEQSAIAFDYLYHRGVHKIGWMGFPDHNHMFTVLGLDVRPPETEFFTIGGGPPSSWNAGAVVCDPWYHEWFVASRDWDAKVVHILRETSGRRLANGETCAIQCRAYAG